MMQATPKGVFLDIDTVNRNDLNLNSLHQVIPGCQLLQQLTEEQVLTSLRTAEVVISNKVMLDRERLQQATALKLVCIAATGTNNVDLVAARELGIDVCNVTAYATPSVVQYVFTVLLNLMSRLPEYQQAVKAGDWSNSSMFCLLDYSFHELQGKTLGIVGYGELGRAVANIAGAFGMKVLIAKRDAADLREGRLSLEQMLPQLDVLSLHCPLTEQTRNLIAEKEFSLMKPASFIINSARGGIVNEMALMNALQSGQIAGAATDVLTSEPPAPEHALLQFKHPRLIITPHIAWASVESRQRLLDQVALNISEYFAGRPRNIVNLA